MLYFFKSFSLCINLTILFLLFLIQNLQQYHTIVFLNKSWKKKEKKSFKFNANSTVITNLNDTVVGKGPLSFTKISRPTMVAGESVKKLRRKSYGERRTIERGYGLTVCRLRRRRLAYIANDVTRLVCNFLRDFLTRNKRIRSFFFIFCLWISWAWWWQGFFF